MKKYLLLFPIFAIVLAGCSQQTDPATQDDSLNQEQTSTIDGDLTNDQLEDENPGVMVGGALMEPSKNIVENAMASQDHTLMVAAVDAAGLVPTLEGAGPFTVFAPTDAAFEKLPAGTVDTLIKPENKDQLTDILTYHVVPGRYTTADLADGMELTTVQGEVLTIRLLPEEAVVEDARGEQAVISIPNVMSSNGVTFVIESVLMPE